MPIFIHPSIASKRSLLAQIELQTGLRASQANTYGRLVLPNGKNPTMRAPLPKAPSRVHFTSGFDGGGNAA